MNSKTQWIVEHPAQAVLKGKVMKLSEKLSKPQDASLQNLLYPVNHGTCLLNIDGLYQYGQWGMKASMT